MTDLRELLRSGAPATAEPDLEAIRARGASRARRQRIARGSAAAVFVAVAAVGLVAVTGDSNDASTTIADSPERSGDRNTGQADDPLVEPDVKQRIEVDDQDGEAEAEGRVTVKPGDKQAPPDRPDSEVSPPGEGNLPVPQPEPGTGPDPESASPPREDKPARDSKPAYTEDTNENATGSPFCAPGTAVADGTNAAVASACSYEANSGRTARRGDTVTTSYGECSSGGSDVVFVFDSGKEKDVVVTNEAGREVFRFSKTVRYVQGPHERRLESGRCIEWTGRWALVTTEGEPVPPGNYRMTTTVEADRVYPEGSEDLGTDNYRQTSSVTVTVVE